jgi:hypothetical protein
MDDRQPKKLLERVKVSVAMKERVLSTQTEGGDQAINRLSHRVTAASKGAIVAGTWLLLTCEGNVIHTVLSTYERTSSPR